MLTLRRATPADAPQAARIIGDALAEYGLPFEPEGRDADVATFGAKADHDDIVAEDEGRVLGVASVGPQGAAGMAWVSKVFVAKDARRRGVGRALLEEVHDAARARGYRGVGLRTRVIFVEAIALYEAFGYVRRDDPAALAPGDVVYYRALR
ncbi:MAG TPA: GNAT family N-acetyltransferase [Labilithrix sp.]|nr:GNAT family N-acetyltransferase [Labilithrix sp.]